MTNEGARVLDRHSVEDFEHCPDALLGCNCASEFGLIRLEHLLERIEIGRILELVNMPFGDRSVVRRTCLFSVYQSGANGYD